MFGLIVFSVLFSNVLPHILGQEEAAAMIINLGAGFVVSCPDFSHGCKCRYSGSGAMPGSGRGSKRRNKLKKT